MISVGDGINFYILLANKVILYTFDVNRACVILKKNSIENATRVV